MDGKWAVPRIAKLVLLVQKTCLLQEKSDILSRLGHAKALLDKQLESVKRHG